MSAQTLVNGIVTGALYVMLALGFSLIYSSMRFFNMSHGAIMLTGAFGAFVVGKNFNLPLPLCVLIGALIATGIHILIAAGLFIPMRRRKANMWILCIAALGVAIVVQVVVAMIFGTRAVSIREGYIPLTLEFWNLRISTVDLAVVALGTLSLVSVVLFLKKTAVGIAIRAVTSDREMAEVVGVHTRQVELTVYGIGAAMAGLAGGLLALQGPVVYSMANANLLKAIVVSILGIEWGVIGVLIGGIALGIIENITVALTQAEWRDAASLLVLIVYIWLVAFLERRKKYQ